MLPRDGYGLAKAPCGGSISNGASHKSSALAFEAKGDGALPSAPTKGPGILGGLVFFRIHRGATGSRGKLKPFMLWVRIPPMEPFGDVLELEYGRDLKLRVHHANMELRVRLPPSPPFTRTHGSPQQIRV